MKHVSSASNETSLICESDAKKVQKNNKNYMKRLELIRLLDIFSDWYVK